MESCDAHTIVPVDSGTGENAVHHCEATVPPPAAPSPCGDDMEQELHLRQLQRENHLLRLQLLQLREQQHQLLLDTSAAPQQMLPNTLDEEAAALSAHMLHQKKERQRATVVRSLLRDVQQLHSELTQQQEQLEAERRSFNDSITPFTPASLLAREAPAQSTEAAKRDSMQHACTEVFQRHVLPDSSSQATSSLVSSGEPASSGTQAVDELSAEAMLQRFQDRKSQRRRRLEQMLGPGYNAGTTPLGAAPQGAGAGQGGEGSSPSLSTIVAAEDGGLNKNDVDAVGGSQSWRHRRASEKGCASTTAAATAPYTGPAKNPNQIGRAVSNAVKNNSWYLCKVLEAALLDTIQARPANEIPAPAPPISPEKHRLSALYSKTTLLACTSSPSPSCGSASSLDAPLSNGRAAGGTSGSTTLTSRTASLMPLSESVAAFPTCVKVPQLLYPKGVSDTALKRAIEESLLLSFRCVQDAPRRLTSSQASDECVPAFEAENCDAELRRCFAEGVCKDALLSSGARCEDGVGNNAAGSDDEETSETDVLGTNDESLDPFARLLLARLSADLPMNGTRADKKSKLPAQHGSGKDGFHKWSLPSVGTPPVSDPTKSKAGCAFMAAASGDGRVHVPKKHFSRLDEVQVEMHAPVIFNQIRGFLRMDIDRFRRAFAPTSLASKSDTGAEVTDTPLRSAKQAQLRPLHASVAARADEATAWRISVSPGKSGTTLLYFSDFVLKTVRPSELEFLLHKFLPAYVRYCERNSHTLLPRFYALATLRWWKAGVVQHFVLMQNVFSTPYYIHRIYDVKGSTVNRTALQPGKPPPRTAFGALLLKDNDLPPRLIICGTYQRAIMLAQLRSDVDFLRQLNVVDYSCMIGVRSRLFSREEGPSKTLLLLRQKPSGDRADSLSNRSEVVYVTSETAAADGQSIGVGVAEGTLPPTTADAPQRDSNGDVYVCIHGCDGGLLSLPIYTPGDDTTAREEVYYVGIIDVLQTYNSAKKLECFAKGFVNDRSAISVIAPDKYAERLYKVLERITV
ncbi:hypothetical protein JIQ42_00819 [Leishmania sp. Namibia]|uniref:hypothetical protein n=1 Tax=Leishmania sp. Namibia TaxID=2802991 RepID=UPI001B6D1542|nr:hypothetical protein JIQ42_00819 [Leishmania sp. Namibia]